MRQRYPGTTLDHGDFDLGEPSLSESSVQMCRVLLEKLDDLEKDEQERSLVKDSATTLIHSERTETVK